MGIDTKFDAYKESEAESRFNICILLYQNYKICRKSFPFRR